MKGESWWRRLTRNLAMSSLLESCVYWCSLQLCSHLYKGAAGFSGWLPSLWAVVEIWGGGQDGNIYIVERGLCVSIELLRKSCH